MSLLSLNAASPEERADILSRLIRPPPRHLPSGDVFVVVRRQSLREAIRLVVAMAMYGIIKAGHRLLRLRADAEMSDRAALVAIVDRKRWAHAPRRFLDRSPIPMFERITEIPGLPPQDEPFEDWKFEGLFDWPPIHA